MIKNQIILHKAQFCCLCNDENINLTCIGDNCVKFEDTLIPFSDIIQEILDITCDGKLPTKEICKRCERKVSEFYEFKQKCKKNFKADCSAGYEQLKISGDDKGVHSTAVQLIKEFISKNGDIADIKEENGQLIISSVRAQRRLPGSADAVSSTTTFHGLSIKSDTLVEIKEEPVEVKIELTEDNEADVADILGLNDELTSSSCEGSLSKLPAFCANRFFDGNRFVSRTEYLEAKLKSQQKKRERRPEFWAAAVQKKLRNHGQQYRSVKGNIVPARKLGLPCNCRKNCGARISDSNRQNNFKTYWELGNPSDKRKFIIDHVKLMRPKRALTKSRIFSRIMHHYLDVSNYDGTTEQVKVCKKMFSNTLSISNTVISNAFKLLNKDLEK